jgi:hypothetical protein
MMLILTWLHKHYNFYKYVYVKEFLFIKCEKNMRYYIGKDNLRNLFYIIYSFIWCINIFL